MNTSASGMYAQELYIDMIANNLANVNTTAYKKTRIEFQDLLYETLRMSGDANTPGDNPPVDIQVGHGARTISIQKSFGQGAVTLTNNTLDCAIMGDGFFQIAQNDGSVAYTRDGSFKMSSDGKIVTANGYSLEPEIIVPADATELIISQDGKVSAMITGQVEPEELGQIELARFINPAGLANVGQNLYRETVNSGQPIIGIPSEDGYGPLAQSNLEGSNVEVIEEMVNMIAAQRAYEINSKAIKTADEMLTKASSLVR